MVGKSGERDLEQDVRTRPASIGGYLFPSTHFLASFTRAVSRGAQALHKIFTVCVMSHIRRWCAVFTEANHSVVLAAIREEIIQVFPDLEEAAHKDDRIELLSRDGKFEIHEGYKKNKKRRRGVERATTDIVLSGKSGWKTSTLDVVASLIESVLSTNTIQVP